MFCIALFLYFIYLIDLGRKIISRKREKEKALKMLSNQHFIRLPVVKYGIILIVER